MIELLMGFGYVSGNLSDIKNVKTNRGFLLIIFNLDQKSSIIKYYESRNFEEANNLYQDMEKNAMDKDELQVVLVSVSDLRELKKSYPNYLDDASKFICLIEKMLTNS